MDSVARNVADLTADERHVYECALGRPLLETQKIIIHLVDVRSDQIGVPAANGAKDSLEPYAIWSELSDEEVAELESAILDRSESRPT